MKRECRGMSSNVDLFALAALCSEAIEKKATVASYAALDHPAWESGEAFDAHDEYHAAEAAFLAAFSPDVCAALVNVAVAAQALYERVEMDESVGVCLSERVPSLNLGQELASLALLIGDAS